uniref:Orf248 n=1 Tax=Amoebidium parasiticum TaxID=4881 RepID=Q8M0D2_AMOPA|nr:Orf248 [Amoebidium parasiticum]
MPSCRALIGSMCLTMPSCRALIYVSHNDTGTLVKPMRCFIYLTLISSDSQLRFSGVASFVVASFVMAVTATSFVIAATAFPFSFVIIRHLIVISSMHFSSFLPIFLSFLSFIKRNWVLWKWRLCVFRDCGHVFRDGGHGIPIPIRDHTLSHCYLFHALFFFPTDFPLFPLLSFIVVAHFLEWRLSWLGSLEVASSRFSWWRPRQRLSWWRPRHLWSYAISLLSLPCTFMLSYLFSSLSSLVITAFSGV